MTNKIDNSTPLSGRPGYPVETDKAGSERTAAVSAATPANAVRLAADTDKLQVTRPPPADPYVDRVRIQAIRASIADGTYRIDPLEIARRLAALEQELPR